MKATFIRRETLNGKRKTNQPESARTLLPPVPFPVSRFPFPGHGQPELPPQLFSVGVERRGKPQRRPVAFDAQRRCDEGEPSGLAHELQGAGGLALKGLERTAERARRDASRGNPGHRGGGGPPREDLL